MAIGFDVGGTLGVVAPDKGFSRNNEPKVHIAEFGDGYEQRLAHGINNIKQSFEESIKLLEKNIAESITNKNKIEEIKKDLREANEKFIFAEKCLDDLTTEFNNNLNVTDILDK